MLSLRAHSPFRKHFLPAFSFDIYSREKEQREVKCLHGLLNIRIVCVNDGYGLWNEHGTSEQSNIYQVLRIRDVRGKCKQTYK